MTALGLGVYLVLAAGSLPSLPFLSATVITLREIRMAANAVSATLVVAQQLQDRTHSSVTSGYTTLGSYIRAGQPNAELVEQMEGTMALMRAQYDSLEAVLEQAEDNGDRMFDLVDKRIGQNTDDERRERLETMAEARREEFEKQIELASASLEQVAESIQRYDNFLGEIQMSIILEDPSYLQEIGGILSAANQLNRDIESALAESQRIVMSYEQAAPPT